MNWSDVGTLAVKLGAPLLGSVIGFPGAGAIVNEIISAFGGNNSTTAQDLINNIKSDPDAATKLAQIEATKNVELLRIKESMANAQYANGQSTAHTELEDRKDARARGETIALSQKYNWPKIGLEYLVTIGFFATLYVVIKCVPDGSNKDLLCMLMGALVMILKDVFGYEFGSSDGSAKKDQYIQSINK